MDALCLAAGKGTRFGRLGSYLQKCMYPLGLTPFVELSVRNLLRSGAVRPGDDRLTLVIGHHGEQLRAYFGDAYEGLAIRYVEQPDPRGTGHALRIAHEALRPDAPLLCWLADAYVPSERFAALAAHAEATVLTLAPGHEDENPTVRVETRGDLVSRAFRGAAELYDAGQWKLTPEVMAGMTEVSANGEIRMLPNLQRLVDAGLRVGWLRAEEWLHLGGTAPTPEANVRRVVRRVLELEEQVLEGHAALRGEPRP